jgi:hypothetical protein
VTRSADAGDLEAELARFFEGRPEARALFEVVRAAIEGVGHPRIRVTKSQVSFSRRRGFAWAWTPERHLRGNRARPLAPLVLSIALPRRDGSPRWKEVVQPARGRWMHHVEIRAADDVDREVWAWIEEAWRAAA